MLKKRNEVSYIHNVLSRTAYKTVFVTLNKTLLIWNVTQVVSNLTILITALDVIEIRQCNAGLVFSHGVRGRATRLWFRNYHCFTVHCLTVHRKRQYDIICMTNLRS